MIEKKIMEEALEALQNGDIVLLPTDTIWGICCDANNEHALARVYDIKKRPRHKPLILLVADFAMLQNYVVEIHPKIQTLLEYHQRPLTVAYPKAKNLPSFALAPNGSVAIRIVRDEFCAQLVQAFGRPIVATSANVSNEYFPANFGEISSDILQQVDYIVQYKQEEKSLNLPSVVVTIDEQDELHFIRD